ncbi:Uncharacterized protein Fot_28666 [Forsythia ovata]|uniref:Uncharacterized protein n=1 Tax=Forsythia ovata TaxID=205694 RepID=A0ABD1TPM6_9LAMI
MPNSSLDKVLHHEFENGNPLKWTYRYNIVVGLCQRFDLEPKSVLVEEQEQKLKLVLQVGFMLLRKLIGWTQLLVDVVYVNLKRLYCNVLKGSTAGFHSTLTPLGIALSSKLSGSGSSSGSSSNSTSSMLGSSNLKDMKVDSSGSSSISSSSLLRIRNTQDMGEDSTEGDRSVEGETSWKNKVIRVYEKFENGAPILIDEMTLFEAFGYYTFSLEFIGCYPGDQEEIKDTIPSALWPWLNFDIECVGEGLDDGSEVLMNTIDTNLAGFTKVNELH